MIDDIIGAGGGGKGGGGHTPAESKDTLRAQQNVKVLFAVNDGEIDAIEQIYLNRTPITSFTGVTWDWRPGTTAQTERGTPAIIDGFSETETPVSGLASTQITTTTPYTRTFNYDVTAARLTLTLQKLMRIQDNGDITGYTVELDIKTKATPGSSEIQFVRTKKKGKASNPYSWDIRVPRPTGAVVGQAWSIKIYRVTADDNSAKKASVTSISAITEIQAISPPLIYPGTALIGIKLADAAQFGYRVPEVTFKIRGRKVYLPTNYTAATRVYNEATAWDTSFKIYREWTDNPIWHLYGILIDFVGIAAADIDVGAFYNAAKYADTSISNGKGGTEPRYTVNNQFIQRENTPTFLMYLLTLCNANFTTNEFGQISLIYDHAGQAVTKLATNANVLDGHFTYSSNDLENRYSLVNVTYNNPDSLGDTITTTADDSSLITRYGLQTADLVLAGCYSEAQAIRKARWAIWTNSFDTEFITFGTMLAGMDYRVGELVKIQDNRNFGYDYQGQISSASNNGINTTIVLDRTVSLANESYLVSFLATDGVTIKQKTILQSNGSFNTVSFVGVDMPSTDSIFLLETATKPPIIAKVVSVKKDGEYYTITANRHSENKYAYIEGAITITPNANFVNLSSFGCTAPVNTTVSEVFASDGVVSSSKLHVEWQWNISGAELFKATYQLLWRRDGQAWETVNEILVPEYDIQNPVPGAYDFVVYAINPISNFKSPGSTEYIYNYRNSVAASTLDPVLVATIQGSVGFTFSTPDMVLAIQYNAANDNKTDKLRDYVCEVWDSTGTTKKNTYVINPDKDKNGLFRLSYAENIALFGSATRLFQCKIYCRDMTGNLSTAKVVTLSNAAPAVVSFSLVQGLGSAYIRITAPADNDIAGYKVWKSTTASFTKDSGTEVYDGPDTYINVQGAQDQLYYYAVAAYDTFDKLSLNISGEQSGRTLTANPDTFSKTGVDFTVNTPVANRIYWTTGTILKNATTSYTINAGQADWTTGTLYVYFNPTVSTTVLQVTTTLATAVGTGCYPLATYTGSAVTNLKGGDGSAFISGSQVIAGSVGASALVTGSAVITGSAQIAAGIIDEARIGTAAINNAAIKDFIQSTNYNATSHLGWKLDKTGNFTSYGSINLYDTSGNPVLVSGSGVNASALYNLPAAQIVGAANQINSSNVSTYIAAAAIQRAQIGALNVGTADIVDASVSTLKIAGNAVTVPLSAVASSSFDTGNYTFQQILTLTTGAFSPDAAANLSIAFGFLALVSGTNPEYMEAKLTSTAGDLFNAQVFYGAPGNRVCVSLVINYLLAANTSTILTLYVKAPSMTNITNRWITVTGAKR